MKAMILAAGRGERMRSLTNNTPKPLLQAAGKTLIVHTIEQLVSAGFEEIVINIAYLGEQIKLLIGNGQQFGANIVYSDEGNQALETAGGIIKALPLLGEEPFLVVNADIAHNYNFCNLIKQPVDLAHLILIPNPAHHPEGDFHLTNHGILTEQGLPKYTFSGIGIYNPGLFDNIPPGKTKLAPLLKQAMPEHRISGEVFDGFWMDIGTPERLAELENHYLTKQK